MDRNPPILNHNSRGRSTSSCNCGRKQAPREDPFDIQAANHDFYQVRSHTTLSSLDWLSDMCSSDSADLTFPIFLVLSALPGDHLSVKAARTVTSLFPRDEVCFWHSFLCL